MTMSFYSNELSYSNNKLTLMITHKHGKPQICKNSGSMFVSSLTEQEEQIHSVDQTHT